MKCAIQSLLVAATLVATALPCQAGGAVAAKPSQANDPASHLPPRADSFVISGDFVRVGPELLLCPHVPGVAMAARGGACRGYPRPNPDRKEATAYVPVAPQVYLDQLYGKGRVKFVSVAPGPRSIDDHLTIYYLLAEPVANPSK